MKIVNLTGKYRTMHEFIHQQVARWGYLKYVDLEKSNVKKEVRKTNNFNKKEGALNLIKEEKRPHCFKVGNFWGGNASGFYEQPLNSLLNSVRTNRQKSPKVQKVQNLDEAFLRFVPPSLELTLLKTAP